MWHIDTDQKRVPKLIPVDNILQSDSSLRSDLKIFIQGDKDQADLEKINLKNIQRNDKSIRKDNTKWNGKSYFQGQKISNIVEPEEN